MFRAVLLSAAILAAVPALAQAPTAEERAAMVPTLPSPPLDENARPSEFLRAAQVGLIAGRVGEAQQALEMAQTRLLDRSVPLFQTNTPSDNPAVRPIAQAIAALAAGDREACVRFVQDAIQAATAQGN